MKKNFKIISLLTVVTVMVNVLSVLAFLQPASAAVNTMKDTMTRLKAATSALHTVVFDGGGTLVFTLPAGFTGVTAGTCTVAGQAATCTTGQNFTATNPAVGSYAITWTGDGTGSVDVAIVDSDRVDVTGYITSAMMFDLDTSTDNANCAYNACLREGGGGAASNYTVDLGQLTLSSVNKSGDTVLHADSVTGGINYINFDLSTNAALGAVVTMQSVGTQPGTLDGPGGPAQDIPSVSNGTTMTAGTAGYGYRWYNVPTNAGLGIGAVETMNASCLAAGTTYCAIPTTPTSIYSVNASAQEVRGYLQIAAAINGTMVPGTYNDVLQFIATATY